jgi:hypothetical protein
MLFPRGKTKFIRPDGSIGQSPGHGVVLLGMGNVAGGALHECGLGFCVTRARRNRLCKMRLGSINSSNT